VFKTCWLTYLRHVVITVWVNTENRVLTDEITDIDFKIGLIRPIFQFLHSHLAVAFFLGWTEFDTTLHSASVEIYEQNLIQTKDIFSS